MKRIISILLCFLMLLTLNSAWTIQVAAADTTELLKETFDYENVEAGTNIESDFGWSNYIGSQTEKDTDITIEEETLAGDKINKYAQIKRTRVSDAASALHYMYKGFSSNVTEGIVSYEFKLRQNDAGANVFLMYILKGAGSINTDSLNSNKPSEYTFTFSTGKLSGGGLGGSCYFASGGATEDKWYYFEFICDLDNSKLHVYCDGIRLTADEGVALGIEEDGIYGFAMGTGRKNGATVADSSFHIDDIYASSVGDLDVKIEPSQDGSLQTAEVYFTNNLTGITTGNITVDNGDIGVTSITPINGSRKHYLLTFESALALETTYDVKFTSLTDLYGGVLAEKSISYKTRDRQKNIGEIKFYKDYGTVNEQEVSVLSDGTITAAFEVVNETLDDYDAVLVGVHKRDGKVLAAEAADASVEAETTAEKSLPITLSTMTEDDSIEIYLWDSVQGMKPIGDAKIITPLGIETVELADSTQINSLTLNASIADSGTMTLSGSVAPANKGMVTAYVLKPGFAISELTTTNFSTAVDFAGQKLTETNGSFSFEYTMQGAVNNTTYTAYAGGNNIAEPEDYTITFFKNATYYVSPGGNDNNSGLTKGEAWASLYKAAQTLQAGDTAIFLDGEYIETEYTHFANDGTPEKPITLKSENKHGAVIKYAGDLRFQKLNINKSYINIRDFVITQEIASTDADEKPTLDILLNCGVSDGLSDSSYIIEGCEITGNKFYNVFEEGIKVKYARDIFVEDNLIIDSAHEGMDIFGSSDVIIRGNEVDDAGRVGIMVKGNSRNCQIYNNYVHNEEVQATAYHVGGHSDKRSCYVTAENEGYEAYNLVFYNNIAYSTQGKQKYGFYFSGAKDCYAYNNLIQGAKYAFRLGDNGGLNMGGEEKPEAHWAWNAKTVNPVLRNNMIADVENAFLIADDMAEGIDSDYNLFYNVASNTRASVEGHSITTATTPFAGSQDTDWHLSDTSPAQGSGEALPVFVDAYDGIVGIDIIDADKTISINHIDYNGEVRKTPWDIGIYNRNRKTTELLKESFDYENVEAGTSIGSNLGWTNYIGNQTQKDTDITIEEETLAGDKKNKYAQIKRTRVSDGDSALHYMYKGFSSNVKEGIVSYEFKLRQNDAGANVFLMYILKGAADINTEYTFTFSTGKLSGGTLGSSCYFALGGATEDKWYDFEFICDLDNSKLHVYCDGIRLTAQEGAALGIEEDGIYGFAMGTSRNKGATVANSSFHIDDIYASSVGDLEVVEIVPSEDGSLNTAEVVFNNNLKNNTLLKENIAFDDNTVSVTNVTSVSGSKKRYLLTLNKALALETTYDVTIENVSDLYGGTIDETTVSYKTRDRRKNIGEIKFYKDYGTVNEQEVSVLSNGTVTAAFEVVNETLDDYDVVLVGVHKRDGKVLAAEAADASVEAETTARKSLSITLSSMTEDDSIEIYLWDSVQGMKPIGDAKIITLLGIETMELADSTQINSLILNASISGASADSGTMTLSGSVAPANKGMVTAYVLKPGFTISALTIANFSTAVDFAGQKLTETDGSYSFGYTMQGAVNNTTYTAYAGGNSIAEPEDYSITFFGNDFIDRVVASFNGATTEQITQMLADSIYVPNVTPSVYLNTVLNLVLTDYNALNDYTATESYKSNVAKALEAITFSGTEHIRSEFSSAVSTQKTNQKNYLELLKKVNDALWGELELLFGNNNSMLLLDYSGSYSKISSDASLLEQLYKKLSQGYTFTDFDMLREKFESEAALLVPSETVNNDGGGGGGGGGGGKNFSYDDALKSENTLTPAPPQQSDEITSFDDLDSVLWAKEAILDLAEEGIVAGVGNNKFAPNETVTREQFIKMIVLTCGLYDENSENKKFVDVTKNAWYEKYVASAVNAGIIFGLDDDHFGVGENISRAEMATILYRVLCHKGVTIETDGENVIYTDYTEIPDYARESVEALTRAGIMSGVGEGRFAANGEATRAMAARVIWLLKGEV